MWAARSHLQNIMTNAPIGIITTDMGLSIDMANPSALRMHGLEQDEMQGRCVLGLMADSPLAGDYLEQIQKEAVSRIEIQYTVPGRQPCDAPTHIEATVTLLRDDSYYPIGLLLMCNDVTEKRVLQERLRETERLSLVGQLAVTLQHEINNPLQTITGNAEILMERRDLPQPVRQQVKNILDDGMRIAQLIETMRNMTEVKTVSYIPGVDMIEIRKVDQSIPAVSSS